ncbi:MAG: hypothetical protein EPO23_03260 [Xanthobacteraceae bacterium]|nr:MAG: hypothetical protein EPO23_03260 [Xanthobacteraceae bacterium]
MTHVRSQIRAAVVAALSGLATTGARVYPGRTRSLGEDHEPTLLIYTTDERAEIDAMGGILLRRLTLVVDAQVVASGPPDDTLDQIAAEVEPAMILNPSLGGLAKWVLLTATRTAIRADGKRHLGEVRLEYDIGYRTRENNPAMAV